MTRRALFPGPVAVAAAGCARRDRPVGFAGLAFIANSEGRAVAAVDLTAFAVVRHIPLAANPSEVLADPRRPLVYTLVPDSAELVTIHTRTLAVAGRVRLPSRGSTMRMGPGGGALWVSCQGRRTVRIALDHLRIQGDWTHPAEISALDVAADPFGKEIAAAASADALWLIQPGAGAPKSLPLAAGANTLSLAAFRRDGRTVMAADHDTAQLWVFDTASRKLVVRLALGLRPRYFCAKPDGGELYLTGDGSDALVTVFPYLTEVRGTVLAGRSPGFVAASNSRILVANPESNDVSIVNATNQKVLAVAPVGKEPRAIAVTPDGNYALVLNSASGDVSVLRLANLGARPPSAAPAAPALTMIPVGSRPVSLAIVEV
ncbi:MAG: hypothetical protein R2729_09095 [Bryobacteraceae bacterium]